MLKRGDECQPGALAKGGELEGIRVGRQGARIRDRLEPMRAWASFERIIDRARRTLFHRPGTPRAIGQSIKADIRGDSIQPRPERRPPIEAIETAPGADHGVLDRILGVEGGAQHAVAVPGQGGAMRFQLSCVEGHLNTCTTARE